MALHSSLGLAEAIVGDMPMPRASANHAPRPTSEIRCVLILIGPPRGVEMSWTMICSFDTPRRVRPTGDLSDSSWMAASNAIPYSGDLFARSARHVHRRAPAGMAGSEARARGRAPDRRPFASAAPPYGRRRRPVRTGPAVPSTCNSRRHRGYALNLDTFAPRAPARLSSATQSDRPRYACRRAAQ